MTQEKRDYAVAFTTVDIVPIYIEENQVKVLVGKKPNEDKCRFIGGFVSPETDVNYQDAALRELAEEAGIKGHVKHLIFIDNVKIEDPRPQYVRDKIYTNLFLLTTDEAVIKSMSKAGDDMGELKPFNIETFSDNSAIELLFMKEHHVLAEILSNYYQQNKHSIRLY